MKHPAKFTDSFIPIFAEKLQRCETILDPFAGTGKIAEIKKENATKNLSYLFPLWISNVNFSMIPWTSSTLMVDLIIL